jgi:hypothetical protein
VKQNNNKRYVEQTETGLAVRDDEKSSKSHTTDDFGADRRIALDPSSKRTSDPANTELRSELPVRI